MEKPFASITTDLAVQPAQEQQSASSPRFHVKRALVAYMGDQEKCSILLGRSPLPNENLKHLEQSITQYNVARTSRSRYIPTSPIVSEDDPILDKIRTRPDIINTFATTGLYSGPQCQDSFGAKLRQNSTIRESSYLPI
jgi:hypothetical protein